MFISCIFLLASLFLGFLQCFSKIFWMWFPLELVMEVRTLHSARSIRVGRSIGAQKIPNPLGIPHILTYAEMFLGLAGLECTSISLLGFWYVLMDWAQTSITFELHQKVKANQSNWNISTSSQSKNAIWHEITKPTNSLWGVAVGNMGTSGPGSQQAHSAAVFFDIFCSLDSWMQGRFDGIKIVCFMWLYMDLYMTEALELYIVVHTGYVIGADILIGFHCNILYIDVLYIFAIFCHPYLC